MTHVHILGGTQTDFAINWRKQGKNFVDMLREVTEGALSASGLAPEDIRALNDEGRVGFFIGNFASELYVKQGQLGGFFGELDPAFAGVPAARYEAACASGSVALQAAHQAIRAGDYDLALVVGIEVMKTVSPVEGGDFLGTAAWYEREARDVDFAFPKLFGRLKDEVERRYALDSGRLRNNLSAISRNNFANARLNPLAQTRGWPTPEQDERTAQKMNAPIGSLTIYDCSQVTDGAAGVVLASPNFAGAHARRHDLSPQAMPRITGWGHRNAAMSFDTKTAEARQSGWVLPWTRRAIEDAYLRAGLSVGDIDVFETHDCFSSSEYAAIGLFGITPPGEEYTAIEDGRIALGGSSPINATGGLIGCGHPVGATGVRMMVDLDRQLRGQAGACQVEGARNALMLNLGGSATTSMTFLLQV